MASTVEARATPAAHASAAGKAKALLGEVGSPSTEAARRCKAAQELRDFATSDATAFAALKGSDVVFELWRLVGDAKVGAEDVEALVGKRDGSRDPVLPSVLDSLAELALLKIPSLLGQQLSTLVTVMAVCKHCTARGAPSERASPERLALLGALR